jgi:hypothetical protein
MKNILLIITSTLCLSVYSLPTWTVLEVEIKSGKYDELQEGLDTLMTSPLGKMFPGSVELNWHLNNGENPATHGIVNLFPSMVASNEWGAAFWSPEAEEVREQWIDTLSATTNSVRDMSFIQVANWQPDEDTQEYPYVEYVPMQTLDYQVVIEALNKFIKTNDGKKFPGLVSLHQCNYCGESETNSALIVQFKNVQDLESWSEITLNSSDFASYLSEVREGATFLGNSLVLVLNTWNNTPSSFNQ